MIVDGALLKLARQPIKIINPLKALNVKKKVFSVWLQNGKDKYKKIKEAQKLENHYIKVSNFG